MAVYITDKDALDKMAQIEGEAWRAEMEWKVNAFSFKGFLQEYEEYKSYCEENNEEPGDYALTVDGNSAIYGAGGWNRWFVRETGEICFSEFHKRGGLDIEQVKALGFAIWK